VDLIPSAILAAYNRRLVKAALPLTLAAVAAAAAFGSGWAERAPQSQPATSAPGAEEKVARQACTGCHPLPPPDVLPREAWTPKIYEMAGLIMAGIGAPPELKGKLSADFDIDAVERYYKSRAPLALPTPEPWPPVGEGSPRFARHAMKLPGGDARPAIANVRFLDLDGRGELSIVAEDMTHGVVLTGSPMAPERGLSVIAHVTAPCHASVVDLDEDGRRDLIIADLGDVPPSDHLKASVVWLQRLADGGWRKHVLASGLPRVADVEAIDVDGDGRLDLVVAAFGWRQVGSLLLLENRTKDWSSPVFVPRVLDTRTGAIDVPVVDLNKDGKPDVVTVFSQHYETVAAFLGDGKGSFRTETIYAAPHPAWGSSWVDVADLDGDGRLDVLLSHGDMLDDFQLKPYHGIQWLENRGTFPFVEHTLAALNGVHGGKAVDLDRDGDLDVVAVAYVPPPRRNDEPPRAPLPSLVWLEQTSRGQFARHTLEVGARHVSVDAADYDHDGDVDLLVGNFGMDSETWIEVWENLTVKK
jgi:VCBS repeat protein